MSAETVATMIMSRSSALVPAIASACRAAITAISEVTSPSAAIRRSLMPVRSMIQASVVSTSFSRSWFVKIRFRSIGAVPRRCECNKNSRPFFAAAIEPRRRLRRCQHGLSDNPKRRVSPAPLAMLLRRRWGQPSTLVNILKYRVPPRRHRGTQAGPPSVACSGAGTVEK